MKTQLDILITNDDGVSSKGIKCLTGIMRKFGNVTVVAPKEPQSGKSVALTLGKPLRLEKISEEPGLRVFSLDGTPADCVKMAIYAFYQDKLPDLLVSGINHGSNASIASVYSGTLGATIEGSVYGILSLGFSLDCHDPNADFAVAQKYIPVIVDKFITDYTQKYGTYFNINFPKCNLNQISGIKFGYQGMGKWVKEFDKRQDPYGSEYYWMTGEFFNLEKHDSDGDHILNHQNYISIVPQKIDSTDYEELEIIKKKWKFK